MRFSSTANQSHDESESIYKNFEEEANACASDFDDQISSAISSDESVDDRKGLQYERQFSLNESPIKPVVNEVDGEIDSLAVAGISNTNFCHSPKKTWIATSTIDRLTKSVRQGAVFRGKNIVRQGLKVAQTVEKGAMKAGIGLTKSINIQAKPREDKRDERENHSFDESE